jgi:hypothetical protein
MAQKTYYVASGADGNFAALVDGVAQTAASRADGWTVAKIASGNSCEFDAGTKQASGSFSSQTTTPKPASFLTGTTANAFKTPAPVTGTFDNALAWSFSFAIRATTASAQAGRFRMRVFKSVNASGASATELTASTVVGGINSSISTTTDIGASVNWNPGASITLNNEYLFFVIAWEITTASGSNSGDVVIRTGSTGPAGSVLLTPNFVANTLVSGTDSNGTTTESASITKVVAVDSDSGGVPIGGGAFPSTGVLDNFNRANGALGANWTGGLRPSAATAPVITGNAMVAGSVTSTAWWNQSSFGPDCEAYATVVTGNIAPTLFARVQNPGASNVSGYLFQAQGMSAGFIQSITNDAVTTIGGGSFQIPANTTKIGLSVVGNTISAWGYTNGAWAVITTRTDSTYSAAGYIGVSLGASSLDSFDDFGGGTYVVAAGGETASVVVAAGTPISGTDTSGAVTEATAMAVQIADTSPINEIETSTTVGLISGTDSGTIAENASVDVKVQLLVVEPDPGTYTALPNRFATYAAIPASVSTYQLLSTGSPFPGLTENATVSFPPVLVSSSDNGTVTENTSTKVSLVDTSPINEIEAVSLAVALADTSPINEIESANAIASVPGADVNGTVTESASAVVKVSGTDQNGAITESANPNVSLIDTSPINETETGTVGSLIPVSDANGTITESASVSTLTPISGSDVNGTTTESASFTYALSASDFSGSLTEAATFQTTTSVSDSGTSTETPTVKAIVSGTDSATASTEIAAVASPISSADSGTGSDGGGGGSVATDNFNRANGALGPNWSAGENSLVVSTNTVTASVGPASAAWVGTFGNDQFAEISPSFLGTTASDVVGVTVRMTSNGSDFYHARWFGNAGSPVIQVYKRVASGALSQLASSVPTTQPASTDVLRLEVTGNSITVKLNGNPVTGLTAISDASVPSGGSPGVRMNGNSTGDNWNGGSIQVGAGATVTAQIPSSDVGTDSEAAANVAKISASESNGTTTEFGSTATFLQVSGSDTNGSSTESATPVAQISSSDTNGTITESTTLVTTNQIAGSDANGTTTEASALVAAIPAFDSDGAIIENASNAAVNQISGSDTGSASDTATPRVFVSTSDSNGTATENGSIVSTNQISGSDSGGASETATPKALVSTTDTNGTATENGTTAQINIISSSDSNSVTTESAALKAVVSSTDSGTITDSGFLAGMGLSSTDALGASESAQIAQRVSDQGSGGESASQRFSGASSDTSTASEIQFLAVKLAGSDFGSISEGASYLFLLYTSDTGTASENILPIRLLVQDRGTTYEIAAVLKTDSGVRIAILFSASLDPTALLSAKSEISRLLSAEHVESAELLSAGTDAELLSAEKNEKAELLSVAW